MQHKFNAVALHGDLDQSARTAALDAFRNGEAKLLIASDVAARGLDIPAVSHVFNFDVPHHPDDYVHRIGRTGRAGLSGTAITIVAPIDSKSVAAIERLIGQTIPWMGEPPPAEPVRSAKAGRARASAASAASAAIAAKAAAAAATVAAIASPKPASAANEQPQQPPSRTRQSSSRRAASHGRSRQP